MLRSLRVVPLALALAFAGSVNGVGQVKVHTETIKPSSPSPSDVSSAARSPTPTPSADETSPITGTVTEKKQAGAVTADAQGSAPPPEPISDLSRLPASVAQTRQRILAAARSGDLSQLVAVMQMGGTMPIFSLNDDKDPIPFWKANYPDSDGLEVLSIAIEILEAGYVHVDQGTAEDMYVWPYFARMPLKALTPTQRVELFKIITGSDYKDMLDFGAYNFYRLGIAPDGTWQFFVAGD
jgi:hypothetical protein